MQPQAFYLVGKDGVVNVIHGLAKLQDAILGGMDVTQYEQHTDPESAGRASVARCAINHVMELMEHMSVEECLFMEGVAKDPEAYY